MNKIDTTKITFSSIKEVPAKITNRKSNYEQVIQRFIEGKSNRVKINYPDEVNLNSLKVGLTTASRKFNLPITVVERNKNIYLIKNKDSV